MQNRIKVISASFQDSKPGYYSYHIRLLSLLFFIYAFIAFLNESLFHLYQLPDGSYPFWFSHWTEYFIIVIFGTWRAFAEKNAYTRKRIAVLTAMVGIFWWLIPSNLRIPAYSIGNLSVEHVFPSLHTPGTISFFIILLLVLLFGRRIICGWACPCVGIRETVGFPFRINTINTDRSRSYRHLKWIFFALYIVSFLLICTHSKYSTQYFKIFCGIIVIPYFLSMLLSPIIGNRSYCRFICPFGATFGILNHIGFYDIIGDKNKCSNCRLCENVCDMGIPVSAQIRTYGRITTVEECMGCGRCIVSCPQALLAFKDVRNLFNPALYQNKDYLLGMKQEELLRTKADIARTAS